MTEELDMEIKIISVTELNEQLRVEVETPYGIDNIGLSIQDKYIDPLTEQPKWMGSVKSLLEKKYKPKNKIPVEVSTEYIGQTMNIKDIQTGKVHGFKKRLIKGLGFTAKEADKIMETYENGVDLRRDILSKNQTPITKKIDEKLKKYYGGTGLGFDSDERPEIIQMKKDGLLDEDGIPVPKKE